MYLGKRYKWLQNGEVEIWSRNSLAFPIEYLCNGLFSVCGDKMSFCMLHRGIHVHPMQNSVQACVPARIGIVGGI